MLLFVLLIGCAKGNEIQKEQSVLKDYLENKGFEVVSYEGRAESYELTRQKIVTLPYMIYWGLQPGDPSQYFGKTVNVEKFIVTNHPLTQGKVDVYVYEVNGHPIGGTSYPLGDPSDGGYWSLEGKTLEELQNRSFQDWQKTGLTNIVINIV